MVTRRAVGAFVPSFHSFVIAAALSLPVVAQQPGVPAPSAGNPAPSGPVATPPGTTPPGTTPPGTTPAGTGQAQPLTPPQDAAPVYGRVVVDDVRLRCWPGAVASPPLFEDELKKGDVVRLGRSENGFRAVLLPLGPVGYVSKRFTSEGEDGKVVSKGNKVAFRYRPRTSEAPVAQMPDATELHVIGLDDGWYKVRVASVEAWLAAAEVQVVPSDPAILEEYGQLGARMRKDVDARLQAIAEAAKKKERDRIDLEAVKVVEAAYQKEIAKPIEDQQLGGLETALGKVVADLAEDGEARVAAAMLQERIKTQKWVVEATRVRDSKPPVVEADENVEPPKDRLERFESIGWLRVERHLTGPGSYYLEKGGRKQLLLTCKTHRFDLSLFVGCEVGVIGPRRNPPTESMTVLDVERIEVLGSAVR